MNKNRRNIGLFGVLAAAVFALVCAIAVLCRQAEPVLLAVPREAERCAERFMEAACSEGGIADAQALLYGQPDLEADRSPADGIGICLWEALRGSMEYELLGSCYAQDGGLARKVRITGLSLDSVTRSLGDRAREALSQRVAEAEDMDQIYDAQNNYREELVMEVLQEVTEQAIAEDGQLRQQELTLKLVYDQGQWWVLPEQALLEALFGGIGQGDGI